MSKSTIVFLLLVTGFILAVLAACIPAAHGKLLALAVAAVALALAIQAAP